MDDDNDAKDISSNPTLDEHLPVAGEIVEDDQQISHDLIDELNGEPLEEE